MTETPTSPCPICRGACTVIDGRLIEHVDSTRLRCEGSFTRVETDQ